MLKQFIIIIFAGIITGCSSMNVTQYQENDPKLVLEEYFVGESTAYGVFEKRSGEVVNQFKVKITGTFEDNVLTLIEDFEYLNGKIEQRIWKINKLPDGYYEGTTNGVIGIAKGRVSGNAFNWQYVFDTAVGDTSYHLKFDDWMFLQEDGVLINRAHVSKWGFGVGSVTLSFYKKP